MRDESTKQAAQEYLAGKLSEEEQRHEDQLSNELAVKRALHVWRDVKNLILQKCSEWNGVTGEQTLTCKETSMGDLRVVCAGQSRQMSVNFDSKRLRITVINAGRMEHEKDVILHVEGYRTGPNRDDREIRLVRNGEQVNIDMLMLGELRVLSGMKRQRNA